MNKKKAVQTITDYAICGGVLAILYTGISNQFRCGAPFNDHSILQWILFIVWTYWAGAGSFNRIFSRGNNE